MQHALKSIGYWEEYPRDPWLHPKHLVDESWERHDRAKIVEYLKSGVNVGGEHGYSWCRFPDGPTGKEMGSEELSDGVWVWPEGLAVYVEKFNVRLPDEVVAHMRANDWTIPCDADPDALESVPRDFSFWNAWCDQDRPPPQPGQGTGSSPSSRQAAGTMSRALKLIGYWKEGREDSRWLHPVCLMDPSWEVDDRAKIIVYLRSGIVIRDDLGYASCRFGSGIPDEVMGNAELSDGVWVWPEGLAVYVELFNVRLPDEFVAHMRANDWAIQTEADPDVLANLPVDFSLWETWCDRNRPSAKNRTLLGRIRSRLKRAFGRSDFE